MKKIVLSSFMVIGIMMQSCVSIKPLPKDLPKSKLLVELQPTDMEAVEGKGLKNKLTNKMVNYVNNRNRKLNAKTTKNFLKYPWDYKLVTKEEVGDNTDTAGVTYYLRNGKTTTTTTRKVSSNGSVSTSKRSKTDVVLENLTKKRKSTLVSINDGVTGAAPFIVKKAIKMNKEIGKKSSPKKSTSKKKSSSKKK